MAEVKDALQRMIDQTALLPTVSDLLSSSTPTLPPTVYAQPFPLASALPPTQMVSSEQPGTTIEIYRGILMLSPLLCKSQHNNGSYAGSLIVETLSSVESVLIDSSSLSERSKRSRFALANPRQGLHLS